MTDHPLDVLDQIAAEVLSDPDTADRFIVNDFAATINRAAGRQVITPDGLLRIVASAEALGRQLSDEQAPEPCCPGCGGKWPGTDCVCIRCGWSPSPDDFRPGDPYDGSEPPY